MLGVIWVLGIWTQTPYLKDKYFIHSAIFPTHVQIFWWEILSYYIPIPVPMIKDSNENFTLFKLSRSLKTSILLLWCNDVNFHYLFFHLYKRFFILCTYHSSPSLSSSSSHPHTLSPQTPTSAPPKRSQQNLADQVKAMALTTFYIKRKDVRDTQNING